MTSILEISILRQQYLFIPSESKTFFGSSPPRTRWTNSLCLSATSFPQVKHLTGTIIVTQYTYALILPIGFLLTPSSSRPAKFLGLRSSSISGQKMNVIIYYAPSELLSSRPIDQRPRDGHRCSFCLPHETAATHTDINVYLVPQLSSQDKRSEDSPFRDGWGEYFNGDVVDSYLPGSRHYGR